MRLADYIRLTGLTASAIAERAGLPPSTITRLLNGEVVNPSLSTMAAIAAATDLAVSTLEDFRWEKSES